MLCCVSRSSFIVVVRTGWDDSCRPKSNLTFKSSEAIPGGLNAYVSENTNRNFILLGFLILVWVKEPCWPSLGLGRWMRRARGL